MYCPSEILFNEATPIALWIYSFHSGSHDNIISEEAANGTASVQHIQPVLPFSTMDNASDSTSKALSSASPLTSGIHDSAEALPPLSHLKEIVIRRFIELKAILLVESRGISLLEITHTTVHYHPPAGYVHRVRIVLSPCGSGYHYDLQALLISVQSGMITSERDFIELCNGLLRSKGFVFCPGVDYQDYFDKYYSVIRFHSKQVNLVMSPFQRVDAKGCLYWYKLPKNATLQEQASDEVLCSACKRLLSDLEHQKKRSSLVSPRRRIKRQAANSNYPTKYLSPFSTKIRKKNMQTERSKDKALLSKYSKLDITLDDSQHDEMCKIVTELQDKHTDQLEEVYKEAIGFGVASSVREVWLMDKQRNEFYCDQIKNGLL